MARQYFWTARALLQQNNTEHRDQAARWLEVIADIATVDANLELAAEASLLALESSSTALLESRLKRALQYGDNAGDPVLSAQIRLEAWRRLAADETYQLSHWMDTLLERAAMAHGRLPEPHQILTNVPSAIRALLCDASIMGQAAELKFSKAWPLLATRILPSSPTSPRAFRDRLLADGILAFERDRIRRDRDRQSAADISPYAEWSRRVVHHADLTGILPGGRSFANRHADELRLVLMHELTHAWCLLGSSSAWLTQGREMLSQFRNVMHVRDAQMRGETSASPISRAAHVLESDDQTVAACAMVSANVAARIQVTEAMLVPWMEGVAVFGETAVDPREELDSAAFPIAAMQHLDPRPDGTRQIPARLARYGAGLDRIAPQRLAMYASRRGTAYMAGYLAVRAIVSHWRDLCGPTLTNERALIALTEATRFGIEPFLPHPSLSLEAFMCALQVGLSAFRAMCLGLTKEQIMQITDSGDESTGRLRFLWGKQGPEKLTIDEIDIAATEGVFSMWYRAWNDIAIMPLPDGVATPELTAWFTAQFRLLRPPTASLALRDHVRNLVRLRADQTILRMAKADVLFWLDPTSLVLWLVAPTSAAHAPTLSLELVRYRLSAQSAAQLSAEIAKRERPRMRVVTFADMARRDLGSASLPAGRIYRGLCYGAWTEVRFAGDLRHLEDEDNVSDEWESLRQQVRQAWGVAALQEEEVETALAYQADPDSVLTTIRSWLSTRTAWTLDGIPVDGTALAEKIRALTHQDIPARVAAGARAILPDRLAPEASGLIRRGLDHITRDQPGAFDALIQTLDRTARVARSRLPAGTNRHAAIGRVFDRRLNRWDLR